MVELGISHLRAQRVIPSLRDDGLILGADWQLVQDHPRRGVVIRAPAAEPHPAVLAWLLRAGATLCTVTLSGSWLCEVHEPQGSPMPGRPS
jgi:hypothetical protein